MEDLLKEANMLGLTGNDVSIYCIEQQKLERDDRAAMRDAEKNKLDAEKIS